MIRGVFTFLLALLLVVAALTFTGDPGRASAVWLGWRIDSTAAFAALVIGVGAAAAVLFWRVVVWVAEAPRRAARARLEQRRREGTEALARGFLAVAAGEAAEARRCAARAQELMDEPSALPRLLAAQAAEADGDLAAAKTLYQAMGGFPEMRLAAQRGLTVIAQQEGDSEAARKAAEAAYNLPRTARWAFLALFEARLEAGEWSEALDLVEGALKRRVVTPNLAERARAALLAASAASLEAAGDARSLDQALDAAVKAARLSPSFAPGVALAARLLVRSGKEARAADLIEAAWAAAPHPALFIAYRDLRTSETPRERALRLQTLIDRNPGHRESLILAVEQALLSGDREALDRSVAALADAPPTARLCGLLARAALARGARDEASAYIARGTTAAQEPDWTDLDPQGRAFAYGQADWTRLVSTWAERGELAHPRFDRRERALSDLPDLPSRWEASAPFVAAAERPDSFAAPLPDDPGAFDDALIGPAPEPQPPVKPARGRRARTG